MNVKYRIIRRPILIILESLSKKLHTNEMIFSFNRTIKYILSNYIPHETIFWLFNKVEYLQNELKSLIKATKEKYYSHISKRMINSLTSTRTYWSILTSFLNNIKLLCIPSLLHWNRYIAKYKDQSEFFSMILLTNVL